MATLVRCPKCGGKGWKLLDLHRDDPDAWEWCRLCHGDGAVQEADVLIHELALMSEDC